MNILILEDDSITADSLACLLEMSGHRVRKAACAEQIDPILLTFSPDVILADMMLPGEGLSRLVSVASKIPVVVLTAAAADVEPPIRAERVMRKPVPGSEIVAALEEAGQRAKEGQRL